jgi:MraZ protein
VSYVGIQVLTSGEGCHHMFTGEFHCMANRSGLFVLPPVVRIAFPVDGDETSRHVILLKSTEGCLWMYRARDWEEKLATMRHQLDDQQSRLFMHYLVAQSVASHIDQDGRFAIPPPMLEYAGISIEMVLIGLYDRLELWCPARWDDYLGRLEDQHTLVLEKIVSLL